MKQMSNFYGRFFIFFKNRQDIAEFLLRADVALLNQNHHRQCGGQGFGQRRQVKDGFRGHRASRKQIGQPIGVMTDNRALLGDEQHRTWKHTFGYGLSHESVDLIHVGWFFVPWLLSVVLSAHAGSIDLYR